jgi:response regulator RpfG family c-di-GMP phosphodiesterase
MAKIDASLLIEPDDTLIFAAEEPVMAKGNPSQESWKLLIVDDEQEVHTVTKLVLKEFTFEEKTLEFISAYSEEEAKRLIGQHSDIAIILLDVVMTRDDSGLQLVKYIREELKNQAVRIILRTGQPGQAPEAKVIIDYDINDYKEKTELTTQKLFTAVITSLRSYRDLTMIGASKRGLEQIIQSSASIFEIQSMRKFVTVVLAELTAIINLGKNDLCCRNIPTSSLAVEKDENGFAILAATGEFCKFGNKNAAQVLPVLMFAKLEQAYRQKRNIYSDNYFIIYFQSILGSEHLIYFEGLKKLKEMDTYLAEVFCSNVAIAFDNIFLNKEIENTQKEIIFTLGEIAEARSRETGHHVKRVAEFSKLLALKYGLPEEEAEIIRLASPMHDLGKLGIPDAILNKPAKLTAEEFEIIKTHAIIGYDMLKNSQRHIMQTAATIALLHHEKYNGTGYPNGLKGEEIKLYGRITAIADVFDAIGSDRVYKKAWELDKILEFFKKEKGEHFDPLMVDIFFENLPEILKINDAFPDKLACNPW